MDSNVTPTLSTRAAPSSLPALTPAEVNGQLITNASDRHLSDGGLASKGSKGEL